MTPEEQLEIIEERLDRNRLLTLAAPKLGINTETLARYRGLHEMTIADLLAQIEDQDELIG